MVTVNNVQVQLDAAAESERIVEWLRTNVRRTLSKRGAVIGLSGGIDSSTVAHLCVRAFGPQRVIGVLLPEKDSSQDSARLAHVVADQLGIDTETVDLTPALEGMGCYSARDAAIKHIFPDYDPAIHGAKIVLPPKRLDSDHFNFFSVAVVDQMGNERKQRLPLDTYLQIVAASNMKQRMRTLTLYAFAERLDYAVIGTPNKNEHEQGFFVKNGDGAYDAGPIAHLFKTEVYQLAAYLGVDEEVQHRTPTTDTYSVEQTQEEFFWGVPFAIMDTLWHAQDQGMTVAEAAVACGLETEQVVRVWRDLESKKRATAYLRAAPLRLDAPPRN